MEYYTDAIIRHRRIAPAGCTSLGSDSHSRNLLYTYTYTYACGYIYACGYGHTYSYTNREGVTGT
jgi:hypothetical protein